MVVESLDGQGWQDFEQGEDQCISRREYAFHCRRRSAAFRAKIDEQFNALVPRDAEPGALEQVGRWVGSVRVRALELLSSHENTFWQAEAQRKKQYQRLVDAETRLMSMLQKADVDGEGSMTIQEYCLVEAWWSRSVINPEKVQLF